MPLRADLALGAKLLGEQRNAQFLQHPAGVAEHARRGRIIGLPLPRRRAAAIFSETSCTCHANESSAVGLSCASIRVAALR